MKDSPLLEGSRTFEQKYVQSAKERIEQGIKEVQPPEEDSILKQMKQEYAEKKTETLTAG